MELMDRVERDFHSTGKPLHVADPSRSMFRIISLQDFNGMSDEQLQDLHANFHVLVTGYPQAPFGFDAKGMATLAAPSRVFTIQGMSPCSKQEPSTIIYLEKITPSQSPRTKTPGAYKVQLQTS
jgi:hypothetical protein